MFVLQLYQAFCSLLRTSIPKWGKVYEAYLSRHVFCFYTCAFYLFAFRVSLRVNEASPSHFIQLYNTSLSR